MTSLWGQVGQGSTGQCCTSRMPSGSERPAADMALTSLSLSPAWCLRNEGVSSVLLGASNAEQLMENIGAIQVRQGPRQDAHPTSPRGSQRQPWMPLHPAASRK